MVERIVVGPLHTNCYIFFSAKKECFIIDPGGNSDLVIKRLTALNLTPRLMVFTHGHLDHTAAAQDLRIHFATLGVFVQTAVHKADAVYFGKKAEKSHRKSFMAFGGEGEALFQEIYRGVPDADILLGEGDSILASDLRVIHTPGHTRGSISLYSERHGILFSGDTLFCEGVGRSDLDGGSSHSLVQSIRGKLYTLPPQTRVFPGHGPQTLLEREMRHNPFVRIN